jgi:hypothetical protein
VMVDISGLADPASLTAASFQFHVGNTDTPATWALAPAPSSVTVRTGAGVDGADRVTLIWPNGAIQKQWLQVIVKADPVTNLAAEDVFYFGNAVGESGTGVSNTFVDGTDFAGARDNPRTFLNRAPIDFRYDYNRDSFVDGTDMAVARDNNTNFLTALKLITTPAAGATMAGSGASGSGLPGAEGEATPDAATDGSAPGDFATTAAGWKLDATPLGAGPLGDAVSRPRTQEPAVAISRAGAEPLGARAVDAWWQGSTRAARVKPATDPADDLALTTLESILDDIAATVDGGRRA